MNKKFLTFCFLLAISICFCSECTDKTNIDLGEEDGNDECYDFSTSSVDKACMYDKAKKACVEKECAELPAKYCYRGQIWDENNNLISQCIKKADKSGCELVKTCQDLTTDCDRFETRDQDARCTLKSDKSGCEIKKCSDLTSNCEQFISTYPYYKCAMNEAEKQCQITNKECNEIDSENCHSFYSPDNEHQCVPNGNKCKLVKCEELSSSECTKFEIYNGDEVCGPSGDKCKIQSCKDFSKDVCENVHFSSEGSKCKYTEGKGCEFWKCSDLTSNCGQFIPFDPIYKCAFDEEEKRCYTEDKECGELSAGQCDLFNDEEYIEEGGIKCVEHDGKCVLNSKKIEYSILSLLLLFLF